MNGSLQVFQCFPEVFLIRDVKITEVPLYGSSKHRRYFISENFVPCECNWITTFFPGFKIMSSFFALSTG